MVIDAHTHAFPLSMGIDPQAWAQKEGRHESIWANMVSPSGRPSLQAWADAEDFIRVMDANGVGQAFLLGWYWEGLDTCRWHNRLMAAWQACFPDRFRFFASIQPAADIKALDSCLREAQDLGAIGLGECHHGVQKFAFRDDSWRMVATFCEKNNWPVNLHVTDPGGASYPGRVETPLEDFIGLANAYPALTIILAHLGGGLAFEAKYRDFQQSATNCYFDVAALPLTYDLGVLESACRAVGMERILFGSDFPLRVYPQLSADNGYGRFMNKIRSAFAEWEEGPDLLGGNIGRLVSIKRDTRPTL